MPNSSDCTNECPDLTFSQLVSDFHEGLTNPEYSEAFEVAESRVGQVLMLKEPILLKFGGNDQVMRVLMNPFRDANPFFHLFEAIWMLSGSNNIKPLELFSSKIASFCSDDGVTANGAYGYRWRNYSSGNPDEADVDQLDVLIEHLHKNPNSRRAVLQMWNVRDDLCKVDVTKDVCCNTAIYFSIGTAEDGNKCLNMSVTNRSNDLILGLLGANYVHFTILQEYMARSLGVKVGTWFHFTNNLHVYLTNNSGFHPHYWLTGTPADIKSPISGKCLFERKNEFTKVYDDPNWFVPLFTGPEDKKWFDRYCNFLTEFLTDISEYIERVCLNQCKERTVNEAYSSILSKFRTTFLDRSIGDVGYIPFIHNVVYPVIHLYILYSSDTPYTRTEFEAAANKIMALDWRIACSQWVLRRLSKKGVQWATEMLLDPSR